ncbi:ethanolamine ammonia-lyase subunit EutC [bacterium]|nr:ethanolamine ammonia-lyase subunit EutC [bacterium]
MSDPPVKPEVGQPFGIQVPKTLTPARLGIGRTGGSLTTREILDFDLAHARARDAVLQHWDLDGFENALKLSKSSQLREWPRLRLASGAGNRAVYLKRPDFGRRLAREAAALLKVQPQCCDVAVIVSDGLSAQAASHQAGLVLDHLIQAVVAKGWSLAPLLLVPYARVGISDPIGSALNCRASVILLGERPGLATPESLGAYFTYEPRPGRTDADRNCISNIHADGQKPSQAATMIVATIEAAFRLGKGGVDLSIAMSEPGNRSD